MKPEKQEDGLYKWLGLLVVVVGTFMAILDTSIVNIAIPKMMAVFGVTEDSIKWVLTGYMLTMGMVIPLTGYLGDRFGSKKLYIWALTVFTVGSALCGLAPSNSFMIVARIIQALGGGMIMPVGMSMIYQMFPPEERGTALGVWGIAAMAAPAIGPTTGGFIVQYLDWRLIFTVNIPVGVVGVILAILLLRELPKRPTKGFDWIGAFSSAVGLSCLLYVFGESSIDWNDFTNILLILVGAFSLVLFVVNELTHPDPLLDLGLLKIWPFTLSILISSIIGVALFGGVFLLPIFWQNLQGFTALQTGMFMFPSAVATGITMPIGGRLFDKFGAKPVVLPGLILLAITTFQLTNITLSTDPHTIMIIYMLRGVGIGLAMMPSSTAGMNAVPIHLIARASALSNVVRQVANSLGVTILTTFMTNTQVTTYYRMAEKVNWFNSGSVYLMNAVKGLFMQGGMYSGDAQGVSVQVIYGVLQRQALVQAIDDTFFVTFLIVLITVVLGLLIPKQKPVVEASSEDHQVIME
ncbi:DHA2 family efflux MFS transporter permease subunit [Desulfosporosinus sp. BG]|uniref:DHA2 family efflux MFS transporter permease subunit n=1 Tax=Desulfosporosinus sp. BG TaxID=1633135 RepID=UPI00083B533B|nr:DHA2 family efflux MFS transporter permease subunit [Desulfosporosinus sp. BG]ODA39468.1 Multidrug resistance MFS transporter, EmrB/QacA subfamily, EmrB [Desulfosporosinus sp. BG]